MADVIVLFFLFKFRGCSAFEYASKGYVFHTKKIKESIFLVILKMLIKGDLNWSSLRIFPKFFRSLTAL